MASSCFLPAEHTSELGASEPSDYAASLAPGLAAVVDMESDNRAAAARHAAASLEHASGHGVSDAPQLSISHAIVARTSADPERRTAAADRAIALARRAPEPLMSGYVFALVGDTFCEHDDPRGPEFLREARAAVDRCDDAGIVGPALARIEARHGLAERSTPQTGLVEEITERELAVLRYLPSQLSQREIAGELYVSLNTVKTHCKAIYRKLGVDSRNSAVGRQPADTGCSEWTHRITQRALGQRRRDRSTGWRADQSARTCCGARDSSVGCPRHRHGCG